MLQLLKRVHITSLTYFLRHNCGEHLRYVKSFIRAKLVINKVLKTCQYQISLAVSNNPLIDYFLKPQAILGFDRNINFCTMMFPVLLPNLCFRFCYNMPSHSRITHTLPCNYANEEEKFIPVGFCLSLSTMYLDSLLLSKFL